MPRLHVLRGALRIIAVGSIGMVCYQLVIAARHLESPDNDAVRLAGLGLPLLFLAFLNLIVWTQDAPRRNTRTYTHFANLLMVVASALVMRSTGVPFAYGVAAFAAVISILAVLTDMHFRRLSGRPA
jgi:hypothetical protein